MESRAFFEAFAHVPGPIARALDQVLAWRNQRGLARRRRAPPACLSRVCGAHAEARPTSSSSAMSTARSMTRERNPRLIVLGGWQRRSSYLEDRRERGDLSRRARPRHEIPQDDSPATPAIVDPTEESLMKIDHHHAHTQTFARQRDRPLALVERAREIGLDGLVITEHDYQWEADELAELAAQAAPLRVFSGAEISARGAFPGLRPALARPSARRASRLPICSRVVRRHRAAIVAAHPFRWDQPFDVIVAEHGPVFDALELVSNNISRETRSKTEALLREHPMGSTGSSDAHELDVVGCYFTEFDGPIDTMADFVAALRDRRGRPGTARGPTWPAGRSGSQGETSSCVPYTIPLTMATPPWGSGP